MKPNNYALKPYLLFKSMRPRQWIKNLALFGPIVLTGQLFELRLFVITVYGFLIFCALSSANYIFNDVMDVSKDRKHPFKKFRPVASGAIPVPFALMTSLTLLIVGLFSSLYLGGAFFMMAVLYALLSHSYTLALKNLTVIDILTIASGYFLRVYAGEAATGFHLSVWLTLAVISLSLFLAVGKRRAELTLLQNHQTTSPKDTRSTLGHYSEKLLDTYTAMFAVSTWITYSFYTFLERPPVSKWKYKMFISDTFPSDRKWLMLTIPFVLFGIMRYMQLIYEGKGESPEQVVTTDISLISTIILWGTLVIAIIYGIGG